MRLLETESLETAILHSGITLDNDVHEFYGALWQLIKTAEATSDDAAMPALEKNLRGLMKHYYAQTGSGLYETPAVSGEDAPLSMQEWRTMAVKARDIVMGFERQLQRYVLCYMHLGRALAHARSEIETISRTYPQQALTNRLKINDMTGMLVVRACRQKKEMVDKRARLTSLQKVLEELEERFGLLREDLYGVLPGQAVERSYIAFRAELRQGHLDVARAMVAEWTDPKPLMNRASKKIVRDNCARIIALLAQHGEGLRVQDGYMLEPSDIRLLFSFLDADEKRVDQFLRKYMVPFLVFRLRHLLSLAEQLGKIGTLEGLLVLHARLVGGILHPMDDMAQVKRYEQDVVAKAAFLMKNAFPDLPHIFNESEVSFDGIRHLFADIHEIGPHISEARTPV